MQRREFLVSGAALGAWASAAGAGAAWADADDLSAAAREAWVYALPLIEVARLRADVIGAKPRNDTPGFGSFLHQRQPPAPRERQLSGAEPGMLTSMAWVNLAGGAAKFVLPGAGRRYRSVTVLDMYGNTLKMFGPRNTDEDGGEFTVMGPPSKVGMAGYYMPEPRVPPMHKMVHAPGPWIWAVARVEARGEGDLDGAHAVQDGLAIHVKAGSPPVAGSATLDAHWGDYFYAAQKLIEENPPGAADAGFFRRIAQLQLGMNAGFEKARFADMDIDAIVKGVAEAKTLAANGRLLQASSGGWMWPKADFGDFGQDYLYRAQTVIATPGGPPPQEILLLRALAPDGSLVFPNAARYRLSLPAPPSADGPWSLALYEAAPDGRLLLAQNPVDRCAVGSFTPGLRRREDGGLDIWIGRTDPGGERSANWLPTPARAPFALVLRAYLPADDLLQHRYRPAPVEPLAVAPAARRPR